jgi:3-oxoacyl-[acyl-carrier protein] reductase
MSDLLLEIAKNKQARQVIQSIGLPLPLPENLIRTKGPWAERPLQDQNFVIGGQGELTGALAKSLVRAGANPWLTDEALLSAFHDVGEAYGRPARVVGESKEIKGKLHGLVIDATGLEQPTDLKQLYDFFHPWLRALVRCGRVLVLGRPVAQAGSAEQAAARSALSGFTRSLAKEIGRKGATANLVYVETGAEKRIEPVIRFLLSSSATFVTGQPWTVSAHVTDSAEPVFTRSLAGKVVLLTGAARGIGAATAALLANEGAHVVCLDRPADDGPVSQIARSINGSVLLFDITSENAAETIAEHLLKHHGGVDAVIHNAGVTRDKTLGRMSAEQWEQAVNVNLTAVTTITKRLLQGVLRDHGRVVCLSSVAGIAGNTGQTNYAASKSGIIGYVDYLAPELAKRGICINAVAPGFIETRLTAAIPVMIREAGRRLAALGQGGLPADVGQVLTFLSTPGAAGVTGQTLRVCGGALIGA